ncbi:HTH_Tnp_Tc3_2 domain-containing protein [Trichonephila clavipes]|nr:HTH_Tnp_Tc3_2 domain-containing protein [Trichonephila clavipes]
MSKQPDSDTFDSEQIVSARRMGHSISEIIKINDWINCDGQLTLSVRGEERLRRIVRSQLSQTLVQITTQLNDSASFSVRKWTVQNSLRRMGFRSCRLTGVPLLNAHHQAAGLS